MAVEAAGLHQHRERELVQPWRAAIGEVLLLGQRAGERRRREHPADPDRADREHPLGGEPPQHAAERRGEGLAVAGVVACVPAVAALAAGVWLADSCGADVVYVVAAAVALAGALAPLAPGASTGPVEQTTGLVAVARAPMLRRPALLFAATTVAAGIVAAYLPLAASGPAVALGLFVQALAATAGRYGAGRLGDRHGRARLVGPCPGVSGLGMVLLIGVDRPAVLVVAMAVFGVGFGIMQSAMYVMLVERAPAGGHGR